MFDRQGTSFGNRLAKARGEWRRPAPGNIEFVNSPLAAIRSLHFELRFTLLIIRL